MYYVSFPINMAPTYLSDCLPTTIGETVTYILRNNNDYRTQFTLFKSALRSLHLCLSLVCIVSFPIENIVK
jgi:hypothetical protein